MFSSGHGAYLDIGFIVDASDKIQWNQMQAFIKSIAGSFEISERGTHAAVITFSDRVTRAVKFLQRNSLTTAGFNGLVDSIVHMGGNGRRIDLALQMAAQQLFTKENGARDDARKVSLVYLMLLFCFIRIVHREPTTVLGRKPTVFVLLRFFSCSHTGSTSHLHSPTL